jgi:flavin-dependent dehydrogenase
MSAGSAADVEIAVVGGGPAGAAVATLLAAAGREVVVLERQPAWRWRACGVFSSPATVAALRRIGLPEATLRDVGRSIPAMRVEVPGAEPFRLTYGDDGSLTQPAVGFDRGRLDPALLDLARASGADVRAGVGVTDLRLGRPNRLDLRIPDGRAERLRARIVVGADGPRSLVARSAGVIGRPLLTARVGLTYHVEDEVDAPHDARMVVLDDGYAGIAPVPGRRLNVGIVLGRRGQAVLHRRGAAAVAASVERRVGLGRAVRCDPIAGLAPLANAVTRRSGDGWLLVGDAAGFLDPFTGEGLHRALVSAELAADALARGDLGRYERAMRARFRGKDVVSLVVQAFLARPALFAYAARRLSARPEVRETMGLVMGDLVPASTAVDPRYLAALLRP